MEERAYRDGFRRAASQLATQVCETASGQDVLVYPIVYLYRHHIELSLKRLIGTASELLGRELSIKDYKVLGGHKLADLWSLARPLLNPICEAANNPPFSEGDLEGIASYIRQLHEHDPYGESFRYWTRKPNPTAPFPLVSSLHPDLKIINIRNFASAMERLADYLDGMESWFSDLLDLEATEARERAGY
jgi:hypothetical protein